MCPMSVSKEAPWFRPVGVNCCWRWKAACKCSPVDLISLAGRNTCWHAHINVPHGTHTFTLMLTVSLFFSQGFDARVLTWSLNGADGEHYRSFTMGLQDIWRKGLQEGHNCIEGTRQKPPCRWPSSRLSNHILLQPAMSCQVNFLLATSLFWSLFVSEGRFVPISLTTEPVGIEWK